MSCDAQLGRRCQDSVGQRAAVQTDKGGLNSDAGRSLGTRLRNAMSGLAKRVPLKNHFRVSKARELFLMSKTQRHTRATV